MSNMSVVTVGYPKSLPEYDECRSYASLLGPIRNAPPWHEDAIDILARLAMEDKADIDLISCPKREADMTRTSIHVLNDLSLVTRICSRQRDWEFETQERAVCRAGILFWFPKEGIKRFPDKVYGAISQVEFGYWLARARNNRHYEIAFGSDGVYNGELRTMLYDIEREAPWLLPMHTSLESLCAQSIEWAKIDREL